MRLIVPLLLALSGCAGPLSLGDFSSVSFGAFNRGALIHGRALPVKGEGYVIPPIWRARGNRYGTDELVQLVERAARRVRREYPGSTLAIGDLSPRGGGDSRFHRSHENGRDADLIFFALDGSSSRAAPVADAMPRYGADLRARAPYKTEGVTWGHFSPRRFDVARNWALVRALLEDHTVAVQYLFLSDNLKAVLLAHARAIGEDPDVVARAEAILHQPAGTLPHDDHLHLRIYCDAEDRDFGCVDKGPVRWWKKRYKYMPDHFPVDDEAMIERVGAALAYVAPIVPK